MALRVLAATTRHERECERHSLVLRNEERLVWTYDVHLLASRLSATDVDRFVDAAVRGKVAAICASQLAMARARFHLRLPQDVIDRLAAAQGEASADYLLPDRRWLDELRSNLRHLPRWRDRLRLLREVIIPGHRYMLHAYGLAARPADIDASTSPPRASAHDRPL